VYVGDWKGDRQNGHGKYMHRTGSAVGGRFEGHWRDGIKSGHGSYKAGDGALYQGQYVKDRQEGWGAVAYPNGDLYEGQWKGGHFEGHGCMNWLVGAQYEGQWEGGRYHGIGTFTWADGTRYEGDWDNGLPQTGSIWTRDGGVKSFRRFDELQFHRLLGGWPQHKAEEFIKCLKGARAGDHKMQAIADFNFGKGWEKKCGLE